MESVRKTINDLLITTQGDLILNVFWNIGTHIKEERRMIRYKTQVITQIFMEQLSQVYKHAKSNY